MRKGKVILWVSSLGLGFTWDWLIIIATEVNRCLLLFLFPFPLKQGEILCTSLEHPGS